MSAQRRMVSQVSPWRPQEVEPGTGADHVEQFGVLIEPAEARSSSAATGWTISGACNTLG